MLFCSVMLNMDLQNIRLQDCLQPILDPPNEIVLLPSLLSLRRRTSATLRNFHQEGKQVSNQLGLTDGYMVIRQHDSNLSHRAHPFATLMLQYQAEPTVSTTKTGSQTWSVACSRAYCMDRLPCSRRTMKIAVAIEPRSKRIHPNSTAVNICQFLHEAL
eukprot:TRINITY_DN12583_c0_g1_i23.p1 TRINITY_DN12583_c0_g1~~TRINITY_DN12583_c0_g1_i23.p1  ORF type:complete len:159 (+),score=4.20 TRINITY_DN12583_c0_g1_i23:767-1243(+)